MNPDKLTIKTDRSVMCGSSPSYNFRKVTKDFHLESCVVPVITNRVWCQSWRRCAKPLLKETEWRCILLRQNWFDPKGEPNQSGWTGLVTYSARKSICNPLYLCCKMWCFKLWHARPCFTSLSTDFLTQSSCNLDNQVSNISIPSALNHCN